MSKTRTDKEMHYPAVGDEIQLRVGQSGEVIYLAIYKVTEGNGKKSLTLDFNDLRIVKESDIPF
jgi:hypothetical protein